MKKETILDIALKLLGIYLFTYLFPLINQLIIILYLDSKEEIQYILLSVGLPFVLILFLQYLLIFKSNYLVNIITKKDQLTEAKIEMNNLDQYALLKFAFVVAGLILLINSLADLFSFLQILVELLGQNLESDDPFSGAYQYVFKFVCGLALISFSSFFAKKLAKTKD